MCTDRMLSRLSNKPAEYATALCQELVRREVTLDTTDLDAVKAAAEYAVLTSYYATRGKSVLVEPLRQRKIDFDGTNWRGCGIKLYGLWQSIRPTEVERRMNELRELHKDDWAKTFPDEWDIDETKLLNLYKAGGPLLMNGIHGWQDTSMAVRYFATKMIAPFAKDRGFFDWGGSDGISCIFAYHHGARDVHLHEPNAAQRGLGQWLAAQLGMTDFHVHEEDPDPAMRRYGAGMCTEVLEHVVNPPKMMQRFFDLLLPGGVMFVTSSFGVPQLSHLKQNLKFAGQESKMMQDVGFIPWTPPEKLPMPFLPQWGFWQRPA